jgi:3-isopropylmalate dehydrogenase
VTAEHYRIAAMAGDGIGPAIVSSARHIADAGVAIAGGLPLQWVDLPMGATAVADNGLAIPEANYTVLEQCHGWLVGPHDSQAYPPQWHAGPERVPGAELRSRYALYANVRPARNRSGIPSLVSGVDLVIVRENTQGLYADRNMVRGSGEFMPTVDSALTVGLFTRAATRRVAVAAFELAMERRRQITIVHKANAMPLSFGLFVDECLAVAADYPEVSVEQQLADSMAALLVRRPQRFDVVVTENLLGDILSDLAGELTGALGCAGGLNAGDRFAMAQAAHGSAPDIAAGNGANPIGMVTSMAMLLAWLGRRHDDVVLSRAATAIDEAVDQALQTTRTADLGGSATTTEMTDAVVSALSPERISP